MIQFPKWTNITLPSVEAWGTNTNILRDPPKSIHTRKIDKVGQTSDLTQEMDDSGDRSCEYIRVYQRGSNPMVSVSYNNNGGNGYGSGNVASSGRSQAFLPYRVAVQGAFRPPVMTGRDLLPLSRQPRNYTSAFVQPGFADYSKKMMNPEMVKEVKNAILHMDVKPNAVFLVRNPVTKTYDVKNSVVDRIKVEGKSGHKTSDITMRVNQSGQQSISDRLKTEAFAPKTMKDVTMHINHNSKENITDRVKAQAETNKGRSQDVTMRVNRSAQENISNRVKTQAETNKGTSQDIHMRVNKENVDEVHNDIIHTPAHSNMSAPGRSSILNDVNLNTSQYIQEGHYTNNVFSATKKGEYTLILDEVELERKMPAYQVASAHSDSRVNHRIMHENDLEFDRNLPSHQFEANKGTSQFYKTIHADKEMEMKRVLPSTGGMTINGGANRGIDNISSRDVHLNPKVNAGGFEGKGYQPAYKGDVQNLSLREEKNVLNKQAYNYFQERYGTQAPSNYS